MELNVVIPLYNEHEIIAHVLDIWAKKLDELAIDYQISVYDDGSKDKSYQVAEDYAKKNSRIVVYTKSNSGHGATILLGYNQSQNFNWIFQIDSDNEIGPEAFAQFWKNKDNNDFLIGYRMERNSPISRKMITAVSRSTVSIFYKNGIKDVNCPYRLFRSSVFAEVFSKIPEDTFAPNVILSGFASKNNLRIAQYPVNFTIRQTGNVSIKHFKLFKVALKSFIQTVKFSISLAK